MPQYYLSILTPETINNQVAEWKNYMKAQYGCQVALKSPAHITMISPFIMHEEKEKELLLALEKFAQRPVFDITIKNFGAFEPRVIYIDVEPNEPLQQCKKELDSFLSLQKKFPVKKENRPFHPHVTIANRDIPLAAFPKAWEHFRQLTYEASFTATGITIMKHAADHWNNGPTAAFQP